MSTPRDTRSARDVEGRSRQIAEESRETTWEKPSFLRELFLGDLRLDLIHPFPDSQGSDREVYTEFYNKMRAFLRDEVDSDAIDRTGKIPDEYIDRLKEMGAFGMKIDLEYGGLGLTQYEYNEIMKMLSGQDGSITALLSAHQSIGVPQPLKLFGTREQKEQYLPRIARGAISAFALTEPEVGSDPASIKTSVRESQDGNAYMLNGEKLWCTNGTIAEIIVVMARHESDGKISAFIVESDWSGVSVEHKCSFMGLKGIENGVLAFKEVRVPKVNLLWERGKGLKLALTTLNTGRLTLPASSVGAAKQCLEISRRWAKERKQWGQVIGKHEAIGHKLADMTAEIFAMESVGDLASCLADQDVDIRLEAAVAKLFNTEAGWRIADETLQIRSGRGYETAASLRARGEAPIPVERIFRDTRINLIFEGSSEIMRLFIAREAVDKHLKVAGDLIDPKVSLRKKLAKIPRILGFYAVWYPSQCLGWTHWPRFGDFGALAKHMRFVARHSRRLARNMVHGMVRYGGKLQRKQAFLFRMVDIGANLFAMAATISRATKLARQGNADAESVADLFCRNARRRIRRLHADLWDNDDARKYRFARDALEDRYDWVEQGIVGLNLPSDQTMAPQSTSNLI